LTIATLANNKTILVVEDDVGLSDMLSASFGSQGYLVEASTSGEAARATAIMLKKIISASDNNEFLGHINAATGWQALQKSPSRAHLTPHVTSLASADGPVYSFEDLRLALQSSL
jgi:CheY-like chemotaxis protein